MRLVLSRVSYEDFDALVALSFISFNGMYLADVFFGRDSPASRAYAKSVFVKGFYRDPADVWMKITDEDAEEDVGIMDDKTGEVVKTERRKKIVCGTNWKIYATYVPPEDGVEQTINGEGTDHSITPAAAAALAAPPMVLVIDPDTLTHHKTVEERKHAAILLADFLNRRRRETREAHLLCFLLFVDPAYQRKGVGAMAMKWGTNMADQLMLPCWIEASTFGEGLYRKCGYAEKERVSCTEGPFQGSHAHMRRPAMVSSMTWGGENIVQHSIRS